MFALFITVAFWPQLTYSTHDTPQRTGQPHSERNAVDEHPETEAFLYTAMAKRKPLSKKIRFEVFKRDSFTCQYCGKKAPDVILHIDHMTPVKHNGQNDILNLITSCVSCNLGKGARELSDDSLVTIQRTQVEELQERKNQIEMMLEWKMGMASISESEAEKCIEFFNSLWENRHLTESGERDVRLLARKYGGIKVIDAMDECFKKWGGYHDEERCFSFVLTRTKSTLQYNELPPEKKQEWDIVSVVMRKAKQRYTSYNHLEASKAIKNFTGSGGNLEELQMSVSEHDRFSEWLGYLYNNG